MAPLVTAPLQPRAPLLASGALGALLSHQPSLRHGWWPRELQVSILRWLRGPAGETGASSLGQTGGQEARVGRGWAPSALCWGP